MTSNNKSENYMNASMQLQDHVTICMLLSDDSVFLIIKELFHANVCKRIT